MNRTAIYLASAMLALATAACASTLFRSDPWQYHTDYASYRQGCKVIAHAELYPGIDPRVLTGWEKNGKEQIKSSFIFADKVQPEWLVIDLGQIRTVGKIAVPTGLNDTPRIPTKTTVYGSTVGPDGPWKTLVENGDPSCKFNYLIDNTLVRWMRFEFGESPDAIGSRVGRKFGIYEGYKLPEVAELMKAFYPKFRRDAPGLESFWQKIDAQDWQGACSTLRTFEEKRGLKRSGAMPPGYFREPNLALENKEDFGNDIIFEFKQGFDWEVELDAALAGPHRGGFHGRVARAFLETGDERYSKKLNEMLESWLRQLPRPPETRTSSYIKWSTLDTAARAGWWGLIVGMIAQDRDHYSDKLFLNMLYSNWEQFDFLSHATKDRGNWLAAVTRTVMGAGIGWTEFTDSQNWLDFARNSFITNVMRDVRPDGKEFENSDGYQQFAYGILLGVYQGLKGAGVEIPREVDRRIKLGQDWTAWMLMPNEKTFMIGDSNGGDNNKLVIRAARLFDRPDLLYMATQGKEGRRPSTNARWWPISGWFSMRSDWEKGDFEQARQLIMTAAPYGGHGHHDQLNIYAYAYGRPLLWVPCRLNDSSYTMPGHWSTLYTWSKNTVVVDGKTQGFGKEPGVDRNCKNVRWFSGKCLDLADATHSMYADVDHRRRVLFVRDDYWIVIDDLTLKPGADPEKAHTYDQHFHFKEGTDAVAMKNGAVRTAYKRGANLMLVPLDPEGYAASEKTSIDVNYIGCDARVMYGWKYRIEGKGSKRFVTVLYPYPDGRVPNVAVRKLDAPGGAAALEVTTPTGRDIIYVGDTVETYRYSDAINARARVFVARLDANRQPIRAAALDAQEVHAGDLRFRSVGGARESVEL